MQLPPLQRKVMKAGRILTGLCIMADGGWYLASYDVRAEYFKELGVPVQFIFLAAFAYVYFGFRILLGYRMQASCTAMIVTYCIIAFIVHHPVGEGGIGEYPKHINMEVNLMNILKYAATIGGLFQLSGYEDFKKRGMLMQGTQSYAVVLGRAITGIHYAIESGFFRLYQHELRTTQIRLMGGEPFLHVWVIGVIYFFGGLNLWFGGPTRRRIAALLLAILTTLLTVVEGSSVATSMGIYHMTSQARFHHVTVNIQIIIGCLMILAMGEEEPFEYTSKKE